ncbi:hypothetical protein [Ammoniphilus sp. YIM 78166]|uniref:hypothetical protein n=1 Tax=Ammoniphilus sp. YIM 78166 TaxID=1644106 RepID=UPI00106FD4B2|nr:hypothetical protein [Ammoniphilus sp. YIM 78166]
MFDPTIYENLKVVLEGAVYDLDAAGVALVTNRVDRVDLATMSRLYSIQFREKEQAAGQTEAEIQLSAQMQDLAAEILEQNEKYAGCGLEVVFQTNVRNIEQDCPKIETLLLDIWQHRPTIKQTLSFTYGENVGSYKNSISVQFGRKINEEQIEDMDTLIDHVFHSIQELNQIHMK